MEGRSSRGARAVFFFVLVSLLLALWLISSIGYVHTAYTPGSLERSSDKKKH